MLPISVCMIAKNEEKYIGECLKRLSRYDWEIVVVDTGSTDKTVEIALSFTPHVYHFEWVNDFSAARNFSISKASNDYILVVDCDEFLEAETTRILAETVISTLISQASPKQIGMLDRISPDADTTSDTSSLSEQLSAPLVHEHIARFFDRNYYHYQGTIHEQVTAIDGSIPDFVSIPLTFFHAGYSSAIIKKQKASRNIFMLEAALQRTPQEPYLLFQLGQSYFGLSEYEQALPYFEAALAIDINENEEYLQTLVESYGYCLLNLKMYQKALELTCIYSLFSKQADFVFLMGLIYMNNAMFDQAVTEFLNATKISHYTSEGVNSYKAYYNIGVIYECLGKISEAAAYYMKCGNYAPALERLAAF